MTEPPPGRLPWERDGDSFVAKPNGDVVPDHARLQRLDGNGYGDVYWSWEVRVGRTTLSGKAETSQAATDQATEGWSRATSEEIIRIAVEKRRADLLALGDRFMAGEIELADVGIADAVYDDLLALIQHVRGRWHQEDHPDIDPRRQQLSDAISAEFLRRRASR